MSASSTVQPPLRVLFHVAAGPRVGFGHLVRCRSLARALGVPARVSVRGSAATRRIAAAAGWSMASSSSRAALAVERPDVLVVDDPSPACAGAWVRAARRAGVPVATIHDLGLGHVASDLTIDGSVVIGAGARRAHELRGPAHMILDPEILAHRRRLPRPPALRVLIALGGGAHVYRLAARIARALAVRVPGVRIRAAAGFSSPRCRPVLARGQWVGAPDGLAGELAKATVAIVAGGVTLYEACAMGVPAVALAMTHAQRLTVRGIAHHGAAIDAGAPPTGDATIARVADAVAALIFDARRRRNVAAAGRQLVDGRGALRVARHVRALSRRTTGARADAA
jgi:spore coat polysaccharide biosynthesis predicted glycosyltransferase SpsG